MPSESGTRDRRQAKTRDAILHAAKELLLERGLDGFSLREVARRAEYSPAAMYTYFCDVDDLLAEMGKASLEQLGAYLEAVDARLAPSERLVALGEAYLRFAEERADEYAIAFERLTLPAAGWEHFAHVAYPFTLIADVCVEGVVAGAFEPCPGFGPTEMAYGMWCLMHGAVALRRRMLAELTDDLHGVQLEALRAYVTGISTKGDLR